MSLYNGRELGKKKLNELGEHMIERRNSWQKVKHERLFSPSGGFFLAYEDLGERFDEPGSNCTFLKYHFNGIQFACTNSSTL